MSLRTVLPLVIAAGVGCASAAVTSHQWKYALDLGATYASGNTDTTLLALGLKGDRDAEENIYGFSLAYAFGEEDGTTTADSFLGEATWKHLYNRRLFAGLRLDARRDDLADIDYRLALSATIGRYIIKDEETQFHVEAGPGFTVEKTGGVTDNYFSFFVGEKLKHQLNEMTSIFQGVSLSAPVEDLNDFQLIAEAGLETKLTETMNFKVAVENKYENEPAPGRTENDFRFVSGVSLKF